MDKQNIIIYLLLLNLLLVNIFGLAFAEKVDNISKKVDTIAEQVEETDEDIYDLKVDISTLRGSIDGHVLKWGIL